MNTVADSYISAAPLSQAYVVERANTRKMSKYSTLPSNSIFQPVAFETLDDNLQSILFLKLVAD